MQPPALQLDLGINETRGPRRVTVVRGLHHMVSVGLQQATTHMGSLSFRSLITEHLEMETSLA